MDVSHVDTPARDVTATRRALVARLAALPVVSLLAAAIAPEDVAGHGRRKRRKKRHKHGDNRRRNRRQKQRCQAPLARCGKGCVDLGADAAHCGACGTACAAGMVCVAGTCRCTAASCPDGCCDAAGGCRSGRSQSACGQAGAACAPCAVGEVCRDAAQGGVCRVNQPPTGANAAFGFDEGITCGLVTVTGADPDGDGLTFRLSSPPAEAKLFLYDDDAANNRGPELTTASPAVPAEAGTNALRLCFSPDKPFVPGAQEFQYTVADIHGAESSGWLVQITVHDVS